MPGGNNRIPVDRRIWRRWEWWAPRLPRQQLVRLHEIHARYYRRCLEQGITEKAIAGYGIDDPRLGDASQLALMEQYQRD